MAMMQRYPAGTGRPMSQSMVAEAVPSRQQHEGEPSAPPLPPRSHPQQMAHRRTQSFGPAATQAIPNYGVLLVQDPPGNPATAGSHYMAQPSGLPQSYPRLPPMGASEGPTQTGSTPLQAAVPSHGTPQLLRRYSFDSGSSSGHAALVADALHQPPHSEQAGAGPARVSGPVLAPLPRRASAAVVGGAAQLFSPQGSERRSFGGGGSSSIMQRMRQSLFGETNDFMGFPDRLAEEKAKGVRSHRHRRPPLRPWEVRDHPGGQVEAVVFCRTKPGSGQLYQEVVLGLYKREYEARRACEAYAPPGWDENEREPKCACCQSSFGIITRRRHHCRNCGHWVCTVCSKKSWPATMLPFTFVAEDRSERKCRVCDTCHNSMENFRTGLLQGDEARAMTAYGLGCVNLRSPYTVYNSELPVHCAARGGSLHLLQWLIEDRCCPIHADQEKTVALGDGKKQSVLACAAAAGQVSAMRYLMFTQGSKIQEITDVRALWVALDKALREGAVVSQTEALALGGGRAPDSRPPERAPEESKGPQAYGHGGGAMAPHYAGPFAPNAPPLEYNEVPHAQVVEATNVGRSEADGPQYECIVCFERAVDCTLVPCGHHCFCHQCVLGAADCPVCRAPIQQAVRAIRM